MPKGARFCPECGSRLAGEHDTAALETPPSETGPVPVEVTSAEPRLFGVAPPIPLLVLALAALGVAALLFLRERWLPAGLTLAAAVLLLAAFVEVVRRKPDGAVARVSAGALDRVRARAGYAVETVTTRSRAGRGLARRRYEVLELGKDRERALQALGEAVYGGDRKGTKRLRAELAELDARIEGKEAEMATIAAQARDRLERTRLEVQPTEMVEIPEPPRPDPEPGPAPVPEPGPAPVPEPGPEPVEEPYPQPVPEPYPPPDELTPPEPARIPEPGPLDETPGKK